MKKINFAVIIALLAVTLTSCFGGEDLPLDETTPVTDTGTESEAEAEEIPAYTLLFMDLDDPTKTEGRLNVSYPAFSGMENADALTEASRNHIEEFARSYGTYKKPGEGSYYVKFDSQEIAYESEKLASFFFVGSCSAESSADSVIFTHAMNVDIEAGEILGFKDVFTDYDALAELFCDGKFEHIKTGNTLVDNEISVMSAEQHIVGYSELYEIYPEFYFMNDGDGTYLVLSLEEIPALGYHAEFRTNIENIRDILTDRFASLIKDN